MKRWALLVLALYLLIMAALTLPLVELAKFPSPKLSEVAEVYVSGPYWFWVGVMLLAQVALLFVPVRIAERRPVTRRSLLLPVITSGLMMGALILGAAYALLEFGFRERTPDWLQYGAMALAGLLWCLWIVVFFRLSRDANP